MKPEIFSHHHVSIVYDADRIAEAHADLLRIGYWQRRNAVTGEARGRGNTTFLAAPFGTVALREYRRGGWAARISNDRYVYLGLQRSRPFREFYLLARLLADGFPVPAPIAAMCERHGFFYGGALMTGLLQDVMTLAEIMQAGIPQQDALIATGAVVRKFHDGGLWHADLNVRNILVNPAEMRVFLIDFDRCRYRPGHRVDGLENLKRLRRSIDKLFVNAAQGQSEKSWTAIMQGYRGGN